LSSLADQGRSGVTRARKLAAIREYCKFLTEQQIIPSSPASTIKMPKKEKKQRTYLRPDEYSKMLAAAGGNPRDFCILQIFLQTGIRVSELIAIELSDLDMDEKILTIHGKGKSEHWI
jgi:integrase/recombinase XerC